MAGDRDVLRALAGGDAGGAWARKLEWPRGTPTTAWDGVQEVVNGRVTKLWLHSKGLTGSIPSELGRLTNLKELDLSGNGLNGSIPKELGLLQNLTTLSLWGNQLSGSIPPELCQLQKLESLSLGGNRLTGSIPTELGNLTNLTKLWLNDNQLSGSIPQELGQLQSLQALGLDNNKLTGSIPTELGQLQKLAYLYLSNNQLTDNPGDLSVREAVARWRDSLASRRQQMDADRRRSEQAAEALRLQQEADRLREARAAAAAAAEAERERVAREAAERKRSAREAAEAEARRTQESLRQQELQRQRDEETRRSDTIEPWLRDAGFASDTAAAFAKRFKDEHVATSLAVQSLSRDKVLGLARKFRMHENLVDLLGAALDKAAAAERQQAELAASAALAERTRQLEKSDVARWLKGADFPADKILPLADLLSRNDCGTLGMLKVQSEKTVDSILQAGNTSVPLTDAFKKHWHRLSDSDGSTVPSSASTLGKFVDRVPGKSFGGQSAISFARDPTKGIRVVIKEYPVENACAFERERAVLTYLQGTARDCVVPLEDAFEGPLHRYLVLRRGSGDLRKIVGEKRRRLQDLAESERLQDLASFARAAAMVLEGIHATGIVWGDVKPENLVYIADGQQLVAIDFEGSAATDGSAASRLDGVGSYFSPMQEEMQNFSMAYCSPERAACGRAFRDCPARPEQDVWSLGMLLFWLVSGRDYFSGRDDSDVREELDRTGFAPDLRAVPRGPWRAAIELALAVEPLARGTASEVRRTLTKESHSVLTQSRAVRLMENHVERAIGERLDELLLLARGAAGTLAEIVQGELECPKLFLLLEERRNGYLPRPSNWFHSSMRLVFLCAHEPHVVICGQDGAGFLVQQPKEWAIKYGPLLQTTLLAVTVALKAAAALATSGMSAAIPIPDLEIIREAYDFLGSLDVITAVEDMAGVVESYGSRPETVPEEVDTAGTQLRHVAGDYYRRLIAYLNRYHPRWEEQLGGLTAQTTRGGAVAWVCQSHAAAWKASDRKPHLGGRTSVNPGKPTADVDSKKGCCSCS